MGTLIPFGEYQDVSSCFSIYLYHIYAVQELIKRMWRAGVFFEAETKRPLPSNRGNLMEVFAGFRKTHVLDIYSSLAVIYY